MNEPLTVHYMSYDSMWQQKLKTAYPQYNYVNRIQKGTGIVVDLGINVCVSVLGSKMWCACMHVYEYSRN